MPITASFLPDAKLLSVLNDNVDDIITISCNAVGQILVNGGAIYVRERQPTVVNTAEIQVFSKGGGDKIVARPACARGAGPRPQAVHGGGTAMLITYPSYTSAPLAGHFGLRSHQIGRLRH